MKSEFINVPPDKCPLDVLAEMEEKVYGQGISDKIKMYKKD